MTVEITIPASTSNLGASFDACGLALAIYLKVRVEPRASGFQIALSGEVAGRVPEDESNLIVRVAKRAAERRGRSLPSALMNVHSEIPLARGLGSSSSAIIAGLTVYEILSGDRISDEELFEYALDFEDHGDNLAPSALGGLVVTCVTGQPPRRSLATIKRDWPSEVKVVLAVPDFEMDTTEMRRVLPTDVPLADAVFNLQRSALFQALISERRFDLFSEALRDRLHQPYRVPHAPGLADVLALNDEIDSLPGLLGVAMSGAGSSIVAFATENFETIAEQMLKQLARSGVKARAMNVEVDNAGRRVTEF
jgi:homoserine kinase